MAKAEKHLRTSGATTVTKGGRIVGNIGRGKNEVPTAQKHTGKHTLIQSINIVSPITRIAEKFDMLKKTNMASEENQQSEITAENISVLWEMTREQPIAERLDFLANFITEDNRKAIYECCQHDINLRENYASLYYLVQKTDDPKLLDLLATVKAAGIWNGVFSNPHISLKTLEASSRSEDYEKKCSIACHPQVSPEISARLAKDRNVKVRRSVARSEYTHPTVLATLVKDEDMRVIRLLAGNENTPPATLAILVQSSSLKIRYAVAKNLSTPAAILKKLEKEDDNYEVRSSASINLSYLWARE